MQKIPPEILDDIRRCIPISDVVGASVAWDRKKSHPGKGDFWACCPFHAEKSSSFHADNRRGRYHCFGCGASGDHFKFLVEVDGLHFLDAVRRLADEAGVDVSPWVGDRRELTDEEKQDFARKKAERAAADEQRRQEDELAAAEKAEDVRAIWNASQPIAGTLAERYLIGRGIPSQKWAPALRFNAGLSHPDGGRWPVLICGVQNPKNALVGIWRIYLDPETGRKSLVSPAKMGLGPCKGGAVRLGPVSETICVCEGVETGLGVNALLGGRWPVWAGLSTSGMIGLDLPAAVKTVKLYADGDRHKFRADGKVSDPPGSVAAEKLRERLVADGVQVSIHTPPDGMDWLDCWIAQSEAAE